MNIKSNSYKEIINYVIFGVLTTGVNYLVYFICQDTLHLDYRLSNFFAWFFSVLFAFVTNKIWVFKSKKTAKDALKEAVLFYWYRILSLVLDMGLMILLISQFHWPDFWAKTLTQFLVIALNYIFSKLFVFQKKEL